MLRRMNILSRLLLGFGFLMMAIVGVGGFSIYSARRTHASLDVAIERKDRRALDQTADPARQRAIRTMQAQFDAYRPKADKFMTYRGANPAFASAEAQATLAEVMADAARMNQTFGLLAQSYATAA